MQFNEPEYIVAYTHPSTGIKFYVPSEIHGYHKAREMAMQAQDTYSRCGISRETLASFVDTLIEFANKTLNVDTLRTDIGVVAANIKYRMSHIVDEQCSLRMGAIASLIEGEDPNRVVEAWTNKKLQLAADHPDIYAFFLDMGIASTLEYSNLLRSLNQAEYLKERQIMLNTLTVKSTRKTS